MIARAAKQAARDTAPPPALCRLLDLPPEVLRHVLEYLCPQSLQFAGATCAKLRRETAAPDLVEAVVRRSGVFWAPLLYDEAARSKIDHLLPRTGPDAGPTIGGLRRYFSGTRPAPQPTIGAEFYVYGAFEMGSQVLATFGPVDARTSIPVMTFENEPISEYAWLLTMDLNWKTNAVLEEYSRPLANTSNKPTTLTRAVNVTIFALTRAGAYVADKIELKPGVDTKRLSSPLTFYVLAGLQKIDIEVPRRENLLSNSAQYQLYGANIQFPAFPSVSGSHIHLNNTGKFELAAQDFLLQTAEHFRPTEK